MSGNSRERRRQARALKQQQQQQQQQQERRHSPPPEVRVGAVAPPPSFRAVLLQDRDPVTVQPVAARLSSLQVGDLGASPSSNIVAVLGTSVETDGVASLRMIVGGSVSAARAERVPPTDGFSPRTSAILGNP